MPRRWMAVAALVALTSVRASAIRPEPRTYARACGDLAALTIPDTTIASAAPVAAGAFTPPGSSRSLTVPAFCRVSAVAAPSSDSHIAIEVWIPDEWNGKLLGTANGGFAGAIGYPAMAAGLTRGYAVVGTDTGHAGDQLEFADGHPEKVADWAYRSIHVMTDVAKLVVRAARGQLPSHAYFEGCSTGGQQALSEAQRYPGDYDGIVAGDPGHNRVRLILGFLWSWIATHDSEQGWGTYLVNPREPARIGFFRYLAFHDPRWDWRTFDCDRDVAFADAQVPELSATSHDLRAFQARGGKLVMDTGWADPVVPPQDTVAYYDEVVKASGGLARTQSFFRFFPVPGIAHCGGGVGTSTFDALGTLDAWIERGTAPQQLLGQRIVNGAVERTRPICAYPKVAHYRETGSTDVAESFVCADPASAAATSTPRASASPNSR